MYLNNINKIENWLKEYTNIFIDEISYQIINLNNQLVINTYNEKFQDLIVKYDLDNQIKVKFNIVNGDLIIHKNLSKERNDYYEYSFESFPEIINGSLHAPNLYFNEIKNWNIKEINGAINLCGEYTKLTNLDFLRNTTFDVIYLKLGSTMFDTHFIPKEINDFAKNGELYYHNYLKYEKSLIKENEILEYFDFKNQNLEINKD